MKKIETIAPINLEQLKSYFSDKDQYFSIDYGKSTIKGKTLLTYLSNLDVPCDINFSSSTQEEFDELKVDYLHSPTLVNIQSLEYFMINLLLESRGLTHEKVLTKFIEENKDIIESWNKKIDSLTLYNFYTIDDDTFKKYVESYPIDETSSLEGVNFLSLLKHEDFYLLFEKVDDKNLKYYKNYFNEYMFKGKNLFSFWANENNPLHVLTYSISAQLDETALNLRNGVKV